MKKFPKAQKKRKISQVEIKMKKFNVSITEVLSRIDVIEAESKELAMFKAQRLWREGRIELTPEDFQSVQYEIEE